MDAPVPTTDGKTVRKRKATSLTTTQRFLPIAEVRNDTVLLKNGGLRAILTVEALNFNLKSETEQLGIISGYQSFVNTLTFPLQIVIRSTKMNIDPYLTQLRELAGKQRNTLLKEQTHAYANFMEKLVDFADIMQKNFTVVVPLDASVRKKTLLEKFFSWISPDDSLGKALQRQREFTQSSKELQERVTLVQTGLENIGLTSRRLTTHELIELYYQIYNPKTSQEQKLPTDEQLHLSGTVL